MENSIVKTALPKEPAPMLDSLCINYLAILSTAFSIINEMIPMADKSLKLTLAETLSWELARQIPFGVTLSGSRSISMEEMNDMIPAEPKPTRRIVKSKSIDNRHGSA
ncbi:MAG: hypothetical protein WEA58_04145 [Balneolaceae bacterium]